MKYLLISIFLLGVLVSGRCQVVNKHEDDFTGKVSYQSDWHKCNNNFSGDDGPYTYFKFFVGDDGMNLAVKSITGDATKVSKDKAFYFKLEDGNVLEEKIMSDEFASVGGGSVGLLGSDALGITFYISFSENTLKALAKNKISAMRFQTDFDGNVNMNPSNKFQKKNLKYFEGIAKWNNSN